jgi:tetratricopeptide (TPR) repeat protein
MDFERAFAALEGWTHFHAETMRGKIRGFQMRLDEAAKHFRTAERLRRSAMPSYRNRLLRFMLRAYAYENAVLRFGRCPSEYYGERVDRELRRFCRLPGPDLPVTIQMRIMALALYQLLKRDYDDALETFAELIDESSERIEDQQISFFLGAALASWELGRRGEAERHYESAVLTLDTIREPLKIALFLAKFYALAHHWQRPDDARQWLERLEALSCPPASREVMRERARFLVESATRIGCVFIA